MVFHVITVRVCRPGHASWRDKNIKNMIGHTEGTRVASRSMGTFRLGTREALAEDDDEDDGDGVRDDAIDEGAVDGDGGEHASRGAVHGDVLSRCDDG